MKGRRKMCTTFFLQLTFISGFIFFSHLLLFSSFQIPRITLTSFLSRCFLSLSPVSRLVNVWKHSLFLSSFPLHHSILWIPILTREALSASPFSFSELSPTYTFWKKFLSFFFPNTLNTLLPEKNFPMKKLLAHVLLGLWLHNIWNMYCKKNIYSTYSIHIHTYWVQRVTFFIPGFFFFFTSSGISFIPSHIPFKSSILSSSRILSF